MVGGIRFEHSHRVIAGLVGIFALVLMILILRKEKNSLIRVFGILAFLSVLLQAALGGLTVIYLLPTWISAFHACLGQLFFCLVVSISLFTSPAWLDKQVALSPNAGSIHRLLFVTTIFVYLQLILGSIIRHSEHATIKFHLILAFLIMMHVLFITFKIMKSDMSRIKFASHAIFLSLAVMAQLFLGFGAFFYTRVLARPIQATLAEVLLRTAHQTTGALILAAVFTLMLRTLKFLKASD